MACPTPWSVTADDNRGGTTNADWVRAISVNKHIGANGPTAADSVGGVTVNLFNGNAMTSASTPTFSTLGGSIGATFVYNSQQSQLSGLTASYYDDANANGVADPSELKLVRRDAQLSFNFAPGVTPVPGAITASGWIGQWNGYITAPVSGQYFFGSTHGGAATVKVNGTTAYSKACCSASVPDFGTTAITLSAGVPLPIVVTYAQGAADASFALYAQGAVSQQIVPASWLSITGNVLPDRWTMSASGGPAQIYVQATVTDSAAILTDASGSQHTWKPAGMGFKPPTAADGTLLEHGTLNRDGSGNLVLQDDSGWTYFFDSSGSPTAVLSAQDDVHPTAAAYTFVAPSPGSPTRLTTVTDPVSARAMTIRYAPDPACPTGAPTGFDAAVPAGMVCSVVMPDASVTKLWYVNSQLARVENPGAAVTDFAYASGLLRPPAPLWMRTGWRNHRRPVTPAPRRLWSPTTPTRMPFVLRLLSRRAPCPVRVFDRSTPTATRSTLMAR